MLVGAPPRLYITLALRPTNHSVVAGTALLEFYLDAVDLINPPDAFPEHEQLLAVARLSGNVDHYIEELAKASETKESEQVRSPWTVAVPGAGKASFEVPLFGGVRGNTISTSQITYTAPYTRSPSFQHVFSFHERLYAAFTPTAGVVIEYYAIPTPGTKGAAAALSHKWAPTYANLKGWSTYKLDQRFRRMATENLQPMELPISSSVYDPHAVTKIQFRVFEHPTHKVRGNMNPVDSDIDGKAVADSAAGDESGDEQSGDADNTENKSHGDTDTNNNNGTTENIIVGHGDTMNDSGPASFKSQEASSSLLLKPNRATSRNTSTIGSDSNDDSAVIERGKTYIAVDLNSSILRNSPLPPSSLVTNTPLSKSDRDFMLAEMKQKQDMIVRLNVSH